MMEGALRYDDYYDAPETRLQFLRRYRRQINDFDDPVELNRFMNLLIGEYRDQERIKTEYRRTREREERESQREADYEKEHPTPNFLPSDASLIIPPNIRDQHIYVPGGTRRGKSSLFLHMIKEDIKRGQGVAVLDPKGTLIRDICFHLPRERVVDGERRNILDDVIYLDIDTPVSIDFMEWTNRSEFKTTINDLVFLVTKGVDNLPRAEPLLRRCLRSLMSVPYTSFLDVYRFFRFEGRRNEILDALKSVNPELHASWKPFPTPEKYEPILTRMEAFYWDPVFKAIFGTTRPKLSITRVMNEKRILLANLAPPGADDSKFYGGLLLSRFQQAAMKRSSLPKSKCKPYYFYVDEFECFQTGSFADIFSVAGGYGLRMTIGNQYLGQVLSTNLDAILGNAGTYIIFQIGPNDSHRFANKIRPYDPAHLENLQPRQAMFKIGNEPPVFKWTKPVKFPDEKGEEYAGKVMEKLRKLTIDRYGPDKEDAEISMNRTNLSPSCGSPQVLHDEGNAKGEEISPSGPPRIPLE